MKRAFFAIAAALMPASLHAASLTKAQICEERALKETYPVAMRYKCNGELTEECKRIADKWLTAAALEKHRCVVISANPQRLHAAREIAARNFCMDHPDARESGRDDESFLSLRECASRILLSQEPK